MKGYSELSEKVESGERVGIGCRTSRNWRGFSDSGSSSSALFCPGTLDLGQDHVCHGSYLLVINGQKVTVWVRHIALIISSRNFEVFLEAEESRWDGIQ